MSNSNGTDRGKACTIWFTGLSGAGKTTSSSIVVDYIRSLGLKIEHLDGDVIRTNLSKGLGFSKEDRDTNILRIGWVCEVLTRNGVFACASAISPYKSIRQQIRSKIGDFVMVHCDAPLDVLEARDVKGLYKKARAGEIKNFTGVNDPYEKPETPEVLVCSDGSETPEQSAAKVIRTLELLGYIPAVRGKDPVNEKMEREIRDRLEQLGKKTVL